MSATHHAVIIGAGPAGLSTALSLRDPGRRPLVVDKAGEVAASWRSRYDFSRDVVHSSAYRNPDPYVGKTVLIVGAGSSGMEIAHDLATRGAGQV